ncbi:hypothetical protein BDN72DRAFT_955402 [Pluteus cervinus]|uniref:Uncharacterized protein n=1 Tax=Pluteus cervinus TaxID=181527 RepID=A0ACD3BA46_9AGAR|nr:hypothetical protein BDN72DRAFT_955402 [Pluteus cervinus]
MSSIYRGLPRTTTKASPSARRGRDGSARPTDGKYGGNQRLLRQGLESQPITAIPRFKGQYEGDVVLSKVTSIGSYNWLEEPEPTIMVPGHPRLWLDRSIPFKVQPDRGHMFSDQNSSRLPVYPLLPLFAAVEQRMRDEGKARYDWAPVDFVTDRNNLRKLLRWVTGQEKSRIFRIDLQLVGQKTVVMERWEEQGKEWMDGTTYGFNFEEASTRHYRGCEKSTGHHQVIRYDMAGLTMVVRCEIDACVIPASNSGNLTQGDPVEKSAAQLSSTRTPSVIPASPLRIVKGGAQVSHSSLLELTTRKKSRWKSRYPKLFLSQIMTHISAQHEEGTVIGIRKTYLGSPELEEADQALQPGLKKLRSFLEVIRGLVVRHGHGKRLSLVYGMDRELRLFRETDSTDCLPKPFLKRLNRAGTKATGL